MSFREMLVALVSMLDNLAVGLIIIPTVYLVTGIFRGIETLSFALFRALSQKQDQGEF
jgi:hypothetical protein